MELQADTERAVSQLLDRVAEAGSTNTLTALRLRQDILEYLRFWAEEVRSHPQLAGEPHWNVVMADHDLAKEGLYVLMVFTESGLELLCARGNSYSIREYCEHDFPEDARRVLPEMRTRFPNSASSIAIDPEAARQWLGMSVVP